MTFWIIINLLIDQMQTDPFWTVSRLTEEEKNQSKEQKVPSLSELLDLAKERNVSLIFDLKNENNESEFNDSDSYYTVETIKKSGISPEQVTLCCLFDCIYFH